MRRTVVEYQQGVEQLLLRSWDRMPHSVMNDGGTSVPLSACLGRVLAEELIAPLDLPPFANSQMDGYAIRVDNNQPGNVDAGGSTTYRVAPTIAAGSVPTALRPGEAAPIMTGAMIPAGANAVVPIELATPNQFAAAGESVKLPSTVGGKFVRQQGSDVRRDAQVIAAGTLLNAAHLGLAAALGCTELVVRGRVRAMLVTTGDEVLAPGDPAAASGLPAGMIFDANQALVRAGLEEAGVEVVHATVANDDPEALLRLLARHIDAGESGQSRRSGVDLVISVGGISAGAFEVVKQALSAAGAEAEMDFMSVAMQPGGPQGRGTFRGVPFLGFPGNPVSAFVSLEMFLRPALSAVIGSPQPRNKVVATLEHAMSSPVGKHQIRRGIYSGPEFESAASVREVGGESSHLLGALAQANALIQIPAGVTELQAGAKVEVWLL